MGHSHSALELSTLHSLIGVQSAAIVLLIYILSLYLYPKQQYMYYKAEHANSTGRLPEFKIEPEIALELLVAANYLNC